MKIILINKFYYPRGGDCIYTLNLENLLKQQGHEVAIFAMQYPQTIKSLWAQYFPSEIDFNKSDLKKLKEFILRPLGTKEVKQKFNQLLDNFKPDIVHLNNIHTQLSPIVAQLAHKRGIKVIWTLHDYKLLCPRYDCIRNNQPCELCFHNKLNVLKYSCMKNSKQASILAYFEAKKWNKNKLEASTDMFICPSEFMKQKMQQGGFSSPKLITLHNFIDIDKVRQARNNFQKSDYYCYVGRISPEKGVETLLKAAQNLPYKLKLIGTGPILEKLQIEYKSDHIEFLGHQNWEKLKEILAQSRFLVIPSEWYENNPLSVIESLCLGIPVLGADIGGIPELISEGKNGLLFESGNAIDLQQKIQFFYEELSLKTNNLQIAQEAQSAFSSDEYYKRLMKIYS